MASAGANHGCRLATRAGQTRQVRGQNRRVAGTAQTRWGSGCTAGDCCRAQQQGQVCGSGLLMTAGDAQAGWLSDVRLRQSARLGGRGEVQARGSRGRWLRRMRGGVIENEGVAFL